MDSCIYLLLMDKLTVVSFNILQKYIRIIFKLSNNLIERLIKDLS